MKRILGFALLFSLFSIPGLAASKSKNVNFPDKVTIGTNQVPAGDYKVTWTGDGPDVQVKIVQRDAYHPLVFTAPAKVETVKDGHTGMLTNNVNGTDVLQVLQLDKINLVFSGAPAQGQ